MSAIRDFIQQHLGVTTAKADGKVLSGNGEALAGPSLKETGPKVAAKAGPPPQQEIYDKELAAVQKLRTDLGAHKQAAHVTDLTAKADTALTNADTESKKPDWKKAMAELATARKACVDGKGFADKFATFLTQKAEANLAIAAGAASFPGWDIATTGPPLVASAETKAAAPTRNYAGAKSDLDKIMAAVGPSFKKVFVDNVKPDIAKLKALKEAKFIATEIAEIDALFKEQQTNVSGKQWRKAALNGRLLATRIIAANKEATRRAVFSADRPKADAAIKKLQGHGKAVDAPLAQLQDRLKKADEMATKTTEGMQFEDAKTEVLAIVKECDAFSQLAKDAAAYTKERGSINDEITKLSTHVAAGKIKAELDLVRGLLDEAAKSAGDTGTPGTVLPLGTDRTKHNIVTANTKLKQARPDLDTAKKMAQGLDGVATAENATKGTPTLADLKKGYDALSKEFKEAQASKNAKLAKAELDATKTALDEVKKQLDAKDIAAASTALTTAADKLTAGRRLQIEHGLFGEQHAALTKRLDKLKADKNAAKIKAKTDALEKTLKEANDAETANDFIKAMAGLNAADVALADADKTLAGRLAFDKNADALEKDLNKPLYAGIQVAQAAELKKSRDKADLFDFAGAEKMLKTIRSKMDASEAQGFATKTPPDTTKLAKKAKDLADAGATQELDDLISTLPNNIDKKVFLSLAEARFKGIDFEAETGTLVDGTGTPIIGNEVDAIKRMCKLMKDVPEDVVNNNAGLKKITRRITDPNDPTKLMGGPFYSPNKGEVVMNSRQEAQSSQYFGAGKTAGVLPPRDPEFEPANDNAENQFDFNMLHELAHSIDDARNFMNQHLNDDTYGGWQIHGANIKPIVDAAVAATGYGTTPEELQYVTDAILRNPIVEPVGLVGDPKKKFDAFKAFVTNAQTDNVWDNNSNSEKAKLGDRIYHEAYTNTWVSYKADARKKGITGYQFRAPAEWFAELYAAWKSGKLKPAHPAVAWLSKLKV